MKTSSQFFSWKRAVWDSELSSGAKLVLMAISDHANQFDDVCWPAMERLAVMCSRSVRSVGDYIGEAAQQGWLTKWRRRQPKRQWANTFYRLSVPEAVARQWRTALDCELADTASIDSEEWVRDDGQEVPTEPPADFAEESAEENDMVVPTAEIAPSDVEIFHRNEGLATHMQNLPTNTPTNRNKENLSISPPTAVNEEEASERESSSVEQSKIHAVNRDMATWMFERIRKLNPGHQAPSIEKWANQIAGMRAMGRTVEQIAALFRWANDDRFWSSVVLSPLKLGEKWDVIVIKRNAARQSRSAGSGQPAQTRQDTPVQDTKFCAHVGDDGLQCKCRATVVLGAGSRKRGYCSPHSRLYD